MTPDRAREIACALVPGCRGGERTGREGERWHTKRCDKLTQAILGAVQEAATCESCKELEDLRSGRAVVVPQNEMHAHHMMTMAEFFIRASLRQRGR